MKRKSRQGNSKADSSDFVDSEPFGNCGGIEKILKKEEEYLKYRSANGSVPINKMGLALSGGGIRSATFSLGVMQQLARAKWLARVDYLSTVSGGGYIGASLTWLLHKHWRMGINRFGVDAHNFPYGAHRSSVTADAYFDDPTIGDTTESVASRKKIELLRTLRQNGNYLTPGNGLNIFSVVAVMLRGSVLSLFVYAPLLTLFMFLLYATYIIRPVSKYSPSLYEWTNLSIHYKDSALNLAIFAVLVIALGFLVSSLCIALSTYGHSSGKRRDRYIGRRRYEILSARLLVISIVLVVVGAMPVIQELINNHFTGMTRRMVTIGCGLVSTVLGFVASMAAFFKSGGAERKEKSKSPLSMLVWPAAFFLLYGVLFLAYIAAYWLFHHPDKSVWVTFLAWVVAALIVGRFVNLNYISIHRYYRDRLMETFMPDVETLTDKNNSNEKAYNPADYTPLSQMCRPENQPVGPYHLINTNVVLIESGNKKFRARGGDSFVLSPNYCGSSATGWRATSEFMNDSMTLPTAMAISGAAANPDTGVGGEGPTRNPVLSILMSLLNIRLGYWAPNPNPEINRWQGKKVDGKSFNPLHGYRPNFLVPTLTSTALGKAIGGAIIKLSNRLLSPQIFGKNEQNRLLELTDGGHFENLGIYELIRRKLDVIIVCDGAADPDFKFADLGNAVEKVRVDFGTIISIDLTPPIPSNRKFVGHNIPYAESGFVIGKIIYPNGSIGTLIYIKTTLIEDMPADLMSYRKAHRSFPDQSTADQFFDEKQFEAYRELGYLIAEQMTAQCRLSSNGTIERSSKGTKKSKLPKDTVDSVFGSARVKLSDRQEF